MRSKKTKSRNAGSRRRMSAARPDLHAWQKDMRDAMSNVGDATREVRGRVGGAIERLEAWGNENLPGVRDAVRSQPFKACAISLGAGALISALLLR